MQFFALGYACHNGQAPVRLPMTSWLSDGTEEGIATPAQATWLRNTLARLANPSAVPRAGFQGNM